MVFYSKSLFRHRDDEIRSRPLKHTFYYVIGHLPPLDREKIASSWDGMASRCQGRLARLKASRTDAFPPKGTLAWSGTKEQRLWSEVEFTGEVFLLLDFCRARADFGGNGRQGYAAGRKHGTVDQPVAEVRMQLDRS